MSSIFYGNTLKQNIFKGSAKFNDSRYQMLLSPASPKQKIAIELLMYRCDKESNYKPVDVKLIWLFKKTFDDGGVVFYGFTNFD